MPQNCQSPLERCLLSQAWRISNLYWIEGYKDGKAAKMKFRPNWEQTQLYNNLHYLNAVLKARKPGISTFVNLFFLDICQFTPNTTCGIIDKTEDDAKKKLQRIKFAYDHLDDSDDPETAALGAAIKAENPLVEANKTELKWKNESKIWVASNVRGSDVQYLHISELGYISYFFPEKAEEIKNGALNSVQMGNYIFCESTHEGGKYGINYALMKGAMENGRGPLTPMDFRFHFFAWWHNANHRLPLSSPLVMSPDDRKYFLELSSKGITLSDEQKHWYLKKKKNNATSMKREFPSTPEECFESDLEGAIYGKEITGLRAAGRITDFPPNPAAPLFVFWDIGQSDPTAMWLVQFCGLDILALDYYANSGEMPAFYVAKVREWEQHYGRPITMNYVPHDAPHRVIGSKTYLDFLAEAGLRNVESIPVTPDVWLGINKLRELLSRFYIHRTNCERSMRGDGQEMPSGIASLENYHKRVAKGSTGLLGDEPVHDLASHGCDALRVLAEAQMRGMLRFGTSAIVEDSQYTHRPKPILYKRQR